MSDWTTVYDGDPAERYELHDVALLDDVTHTVRGKVLRRLRDPHTVAELAEQLDVPVTRLYHHINRLDELGLIRVVATRRVGAATERRYQTVAKSFAIAHELLDDPDGTALAAAMGGLFDVAKIGMQKGVEAGVLRGVDIEEHGMLSLAEVHLSPERRAELLQRLRALLEEFESEERGEPMTLFIAAYPGS